MVSVRPRDVTRRPLVEPKPIMDTRKIEAESLSQQQQAIEQAKIQSGYNVQQQNISNISKQISDAQKEMQNIEKRRIEAIKKTEGNPGLRKKVNADFQAERERISAKVRSLKEGLRVAKTGAITSKNLQKYIAEYAGYQKEEARRQEKTLLVKRKYGKAAKVSPVDISTYKEFGLNPIYDKSGRISGFEDTTRKQSYRFEELGRFRPEILPQLKKAGVIDYKEEKVYRDTPTLAYKDVLTGEILSSIKAPSSRYVPVAVSPTTGKELGALSQLKVKAEYPEAFEVKVKELPFIEKTYKKVKDWYTDTGKIKAVTVDLVDERGIPTGQRAIVPEKELTKGELMAQRIQESKFHKWATKSQMSEQERKEWYTVHGITGLAVGGAIIGGVTPALTTKQLTTTAGIVFHEPITKFTEEILPVETPTQRLLSSAALTALAPSPILAAYGTKFGKEAILRPSETVEALQYQVAEEPETIVGMLIGGKLRKPIRTQVGKILSGKQVRAKEITLPSGEKVRVVDLTAPTGQKVRVLLQEGKYAASEKFSIREQLRIAAEAKGQHFFVQTSPTPIPTTKFKAGKYGIDITVERGLYLAPESGITTKGVPQAFTEYMELGGRTKTIGRLKYLWKKLKGEDIKTAKGGRKAINIFQREFPNAPKWLQEALIKKGKGLSKQTQININNWAERFDIANKGKKFNVPGKGEVNANIFIKAILKDQKISGNKLKSAKAIYQYNIETQKGIIGGPEFITTPHGEEWQLIEPFGKKITKVLTTREKILRKLKIERGKEYTILDSDIIDISWFMESKPSKIPTKKLPLKPLTPDISNIFLEGLIDISKKPKIVRRPKVVKIREPLVRFSLVDIPRRVERVKKREVKRKPIKRVRPPKVRDVSREIMASLIERLRPIKPREPIPRIRKPTIRERPIISRPPTPRPTRQPPIKITELLYKPPKKKVKKKVKKKEVKKPRKYKPKPTGFEAALGITPTARARKRIYTGFEAIRFQ